MEITKFKCKLTTDERETHYLICANDDDFIEAETTIPKDYNKMKRCGWEQTIEYLNPDGTVAGGVFRAPRRALSVRNMAKKKLSEKQKENIQKMRAAKNVLTAATK